MKFFVSLLAILCVPIFTWQIRQHYFKHLRAPLLEQCRKALADKDFDQVHVKLDEEDYLDAKLSGRVATPELRDAAQRKVDALLGARVKSGDNHIQVIAKVEGKLANGKLLLRGYLPSLKLENQLVALIERERPDLNEHVERGVIACKEAEPVSEISSEPTVWPVWAEDIRKQLGRPASLFIERGGEGVIQVAGEIPGNEWSKRIYQTLRTADSNYRVDCSGLKIGLLVMDAPFLKTGITEKILHGLFSTHGNSLFQAGPEGIQAKTSPERSGAEWKQLVTQIQKEMNK